MIDLHTHTTASDGSLTPRQLVKLAKQRGVTTLGITDHDTVAGLEEARRAGTEFGVEIISGIEFSAEFSPGVMHLLGYEIDIKYPPLKEKLEVQIAGRNSRNPRIVEALQKLGLDISLGEVQAAAGGDVVGRPHFGKVLMAKGYVKSVDEAFKFYLDRGRPGYISQEKISPTEAIALIRGAGGVPVLAHPYQTRLSTPELLEKQVSKLVDEGLQGIEVYYSLHTLEMRAEYNRLANKFKLLKTGGSDFHGDSKPKIQLGTGLGELVVPEEVRTALRRRTKSLAF